MDTTAADVLLELDRELNAQGTSLVFAELKHRVRAKIERYELTREIEPQHFYPHHRSCRQPPIWPKPAPNGAQETTGKPAGCFLLAGSGELVLSRPRSGLS